MKYLIKNFNDELVTEIDTKEQLELFMDGCSEKNLYCFYWDTDLKERLIEGGIDQDAIRLIHSMEDE